MPGSLRLASLLGTQLLVPPRAGSRAPHTNLNCGRNGFKHCNPAFIQLGPARHANKIGLAAVPAQRGNQIASPLFQRGFTSWGRWKAEKPTVLPGLQQLRRAAKDGANLNSRENTHLCPLARNSLRTCHSFAAMRAR